VAVVCVASIGTQNQVSAQFIGGGIIQQIGGVHVDAKGVVNTATADLSQRVRADLLKSLEVPKGAMAEKSAMRVVSLKKLHAAIAQAVENEERLSDSILFLAGMQKIQYVFVDKENNDILLAGPGEGWTVDERGNVVGKTTGLPVLRLEDLLMALRSSDEARTGNGISVSINPTEKGNKALASFYRKFKSSGQKFNSNIATMVEKTLGPQDITLTGVNKNSRFAQILVAADYKMKRLSMGFERSPVEKMPSFLEMCQKSNSNVGTLSPRFWMECNYKPVKHTEDKLSFQIEGSVKALTENEVMENSGKRTGTGKSNKMAKKWADSMTENFEELAKSEPVFAELQNLMYMSVVAALIEKHDLLYTAGVKLPLMMDESQLETPDLFVPKTVPTQCSFCSLSNSTLVTASGGVQLDSWSVIDQLKLDRETGKARTVAMKSSGDAWWWNAE